MTSWMKPTAEQIDRALALLVRPEYARTFFDRLENPEWIEPLRTHGFFHSPPPAQFEDEGRTVVLTKWPASRYLVRIAEQKDGSYAEAVQQALLAIPEDTDNDTVHEDLICPTRQYRRTACRTRIPVDQDQQMATRTHPSETARVNRYPTERRPDCRRTWSAKSGSCVSS